MKGMEAPEVEPLLDERIAVTVPPAMVKITPPMQSSGASCEIEERGDDPESPFTPCCRICLEGGSRGDDLISPCLCKGTQQFVHRDCLDQWRSVKEGFAFSHCTTCKAQFHLRIEMSEDCSWRKMKFHFFVARDVIFVFLMTQMAIVVLGYLAYWMDRNGNFRNSFNGPWELILSKHPIPFYYCFGVVLFFAAIGIFGLLFHCASPSSDGESGSRNRSGGNTVVSDSADGESRSRNRSGGNTVVFYSTDGESGSRNPSGGDGNVNCAGALAGILGILVVIFVIIGIAYCLFAATMAIQHIWQKHYHMLAKRVLTKEYIVEDLHGCYTPPKLDPEHEERLKSLGLL